MPIKNSQQNIFRSPILWLTVVVFVTYIILTGIYQLMELSGKVAEKMYTLGDIVLIPFGISILLSIIPIFSQRDRRYFYLPFLISVLTFVFLYAVWIMNGGSEIARMNYEKTVFFGHTGAELPSGIADVKQFDTGPSFLGDGERELSFKMSADDLRTWMEKTEFVWKGGSYKDAGTTLNNFTEGGRLIFEDSDVLQYVHINRNPDDPEGRYSANYTNIFVNLMGGWVLIVDYDS